MNIFTRRPSSASRGRSRSLSGTFQRGTKARSNSFSNDSPFLRGTEHGDSFERLDCSLKLSDNKLVLDEQGNWVYEQQLDHSTEREMERLKILVGQLEADLKKRDTQVLELSEKNNLLGFQNRILVELLAVAQLDAEKNNEEWQKEELKTQALKFELATTNIEIYRRKRAERDRERRDSLRG